MMTALQDIGLRGVMKLNEPMSKHTTWRIGGPADQFYTPADMDDLAQLLKSIAPIEQVFWLGLGSNLLVRDGGIRGTVIALKGSLSEIRLLDDCRLQVGAGATCASARSIAVCVMTSAWLAITMSARRALRAARSMKHLR